MAKIPNSLIEQLNVNDVVPLIGAGVSMSLTKNDKRLFPSWKGLLEAAGEKLKSEGQDDGATLVNIYIKEGKYQKAAEEAHQRLKGKIWINFIREQFDHPLEELDIDCKELPKSIWELSNRIITLNYDLVLNWAHPEPYKLVTIDNSNSGSFNDFLNCTYEKDIVWHLHGKLNSPEHIILNAESYIGLYNEDISKDYKSAITTLKRTVGSKSLLFIGCSLNDAELLQVLAKEYELFSKNSATHYALVCKDDHEKINTIIEDNKLPIVLIQYESHGEPLLKLVNELISKKKGLEIDEKTIARNHIKKVNDEVIYLKSSPINSINKYENLESKIHNIKFPLQQAHFTIKNLEYINENSILIISTDISENGLTIENESMSKGYLDFDEFEYSIPNDPKLVLIFTNQVPLEEQLENYTIPTIFVPYGDSKDHPNYKKIPAINKSLIKGNISSFFSDCLVVNMDSQVKVNPSKAIFSTKESDIDSKITVSSIERFIGRTSDLLAISNEIDNIRNNALFLTIKGSGGLGKTTIAKKIAYEFKVRNTFPDGINFIDCEFIDSIDLFKSELSLLFKIVNDDNIVNNITSINKSNKNNRLIILDNFESITSLSKLDSSKIIKLIEKLSGSVVFLLTSRVLTDSINEHSYTLRALETEEAITLFHSYSKNRFIKTENKLIKKLLEEYLDNNPLAVKIISKNLPSGKDFSYLLNEIEADFFNSVDQGLSDDYDENHIHRSDSIYASVNYSFSRLTKIEQEALMCLSLFPSGIDISALKVTERNRNSKDSITTNVKGKTKSIIKDREISSLHKKSLIENDDGNIYLHSIIGRFASVNLRKRDDMKFYRLFAFNYNSANSSHLLNYGGFHKSVSSATRQVHNFLKAIEISKEFIKQDPTVYLLYLDRLWKLFHYTQFIEPLKNAIIEQYAFVDSLCRNDDEKLFHEIIKIKSSYYSGEFESSFSELNNLIPLNKLSMCNVNADDHCLYNSLRAANHIYMLQGHLKSSLKQIAEFGVEAKSYPSELAYAGYVHNKLLSTVEKESIYFECKFISNEISIKEIDLYLSNLCAGADLERTQVSFIRHKVEQLSYKEIEKLPSVTPYTLGLKHLMFALLLSKENIKKNNDEIHQNFELAKKNLFNIKYHYVQSLYYFTKFLCESNEDYNNELLHGIGLCEEFGYSFWAFKFRQIGNSLSSTPSYSVCADIPFLNESENKSLQSHIKSNIKTLSKL
ncbi:SIR2 family protein [Vibrio lentus]|uniref:SIR2 family protein n=1 Tax=Vibrio lentus TaxID=136468 RepID=UPI000978676A|nr:SIR2 family protein [Vibrio lentus]OMO23166.1 hypothetical protein BH583_07560 [Vibrio lentus]PMN13584.1 hypothetical protein BCT38_20870 [Vibrio lentus]